MPNYSGRGKLKILEKQLSSSFNYSPILGNLDNFPWCILFDPSTVRHERVLSQDLDIYLELWQSDRKMAVCVCDAFIVL